MEGFRLLKVREWWRNFYRSTFGLADPIVTTTLLLTFWNWRQNDADQDGL
jgi:hypothetical protein